MAKTSMLLLSTEDIWHALMAACRANAADRMR
jgi:hypothetical protein